MAKIRIDARDALRDITINVEIRHMRRAKIQLWIALRLVRLAARIGNLGLKESEAIGVLVRDPLPSPKVDPAAQLLPYPDPTGDQ